MREILVCATWRSGSTLVCEDLTNAGLGRPREHFTGWQKGLGRDWRSEFSALVDRGSANNIFATKLMAVQVSDVESCLATFIDATGVAYPHIAAAFPKAHWLWVRRHDTLGQAISSHRARTSGVYHLMTTPHGYAKGAKASVKRPEAADYNYKDILAAWALMRRHDFMWGEFFRLNGIQPLTLWYEDVAEMPTCAPVVADWIDTPLPIVPRERTLKKLADERTEELRARFLREFFAT